MKDKIKQTLGKYTLELKKNTENPAGLATLGAEISATYAHFTALYIDYKLKYAEFYKEHKKKDDKGKLVSDTFVEQLFLTTEDGQNWYALKRALRSLELVAQTIKTVIYNANTEARLAPMAEV